jgi:hypothetical protein
MSSGPFTYTLSAAAAYVIRSLMERPELQTPEDIAGGARADDAIDADGARGGLRELADHGLAEEQSPGRWHLTGAGREAQQRA